MKLIVDQSEWKGRSVSVLRHAFAAIVKELGLDDVDEDVRLVVNFDPPPGEEGGTNAEVRHPMLMRLSSLPLATQLATMCHEMVHVRDIIRGDLRFTHNDVIWRGKKYPRGLMTVSAMKADSRFAQDNLPWETEAYNMAPIIAAKMVTQLSEADIKELSVSVTFTMGVALGKGGKG